MFMTRSPCLHLHGVLLMAPRADGPWGGRHDHDRALNPQRDAAELDCHHGNYPGAPLRFSSSQGEYHNRHVKSPPGGSPWH